MSIHLALQISADQQAAVERFLKDIYGAVGSFVSHCVDRNDVRCDQASSEGGATQASSEITIRAAGANLGEVLRGHHLRAGRALLDWSMSDLAYASRLSLSTVRRLEQDAEGVLIRNRRSAAEALQDAGISFFSLSNGAVAVVALADVDVDAVR